MMAIGIDRAIHLVTDGERVGSAGDGARRSSRPSEHDAEPYDLLLFGNESADAGNYQVAIRVAHALGLPGASPASRRSRVDGGRAALRAGGRRRPRRLRGAAAGRGHGQGGHQPPALPVGAGPDARQAQAARGRQHRARPEPRLEMVRLALPPGSGKQAEILGHGAEAAPRGGRRPARVWGWSDGRPRVRRGRRSDELSQQALDVRPRSGRGGPRRRDRRPPTATPRPPGPRRSSSGQPERTAASAVVAPGSDRGNEVLAHVAAKLDQPMAANCTSRHPGRSGDGDARALGREPARGGAASRLAAAAHGRSPRRRRRADRRRVPLPSSRRIDLARRPRWCVCPSAFRRRPPACRWPTPTSSSPAAAASARPRASS